MPLVHQNTMSPPTPWSDYSDLNFTPKPSTLNPESLNLRERMALRVCFALGSVVGPWFWLGCSVFVCVCVFACFFVCCGSLFLFVMCVCAWDLRQK